MVHHIFCHTCGLVSPHFIGSKHEKDFFSMGDPSRPEESYDDIQKRRRQCHKDGTDFSIAPSKLFFCSEKCYLDDVFLRYCAARKKVKYWGKEGVPDFDATTHTFAEKYDSVVADARENPALGMFLARNGIKRMPRPPVYVSVDTTTKSTEPEEKFELVRGDSWADY